MKLLLLVNLCFILCAYPIQIRAYDYKYNDTTDTVNINSDYFLNLRNVAESFSDKEQRDSLKKYAQITYELAQKQGESKHVLWTADQLAKMYEEQGDFRRALQYQKSARDAENIIHKEMSDLGLTETEQLKAEHHEKLADALAHQQAESRKSTLMIVGIFALAVSSKTFLLYIIIRRKKSHNKELRILLDQVERQNQQLDESARFKQHLISVVAHDLRTPVASIITLLKLFEDGYLSENETRDMLHKARIEMDLLKKFLEELLSWIVAQGDGLNAAAERFDITDVVDETVSVYHRQAEEKQIRLEVESTPQLFVYADKQMIKITINNLLNNALKFCQSNDQISIIVKNTDNGKVSVVVRDTGIGFPTKIDKKLNEFSQKGVLGTRGERGTGIGLSLCILYLNANNSYLNLVSEPGKGAKFWFELETTSNKGGATA